MPNEMVQMISRRPLRRAKGATLTELLVASVLLGVSMAALGEVMGFMTLMAGRFSNKSSVIDSQRVIVSRIAADVRAARRFGDSFANLGERYQFPSSSNPLYGAGKIVVDGSPYYLSSHTLVIQAPTFYKGPDSISAKYDPFPIAFRPTDTTVAPVQAPPPSKKCENLETIIYDVVPSTVSQRWDLVMKRFPGASINTFPAGIPPSVPKSIVDSPPQKIGIGITGPLSRTGDPYPVVFEYYARGITGKITRIDPSSLSNPGVVDTIIGVGINLEMKRNDSASASTSSDRPVGLHTEVYVRTNYGVLHEQ